MRVVWRDSLKPKEYKPIRYRKFYVFGTPNGWTTSLPGDKNIYKNHYCALNAIDAYYGDLGMRGPEKRRAYGIQIVGQETG